MLQTSRTPTWRSEIYRAAGPVRWAGHTPALYLSALGRFFSSGRFVFQQVSPCFALHLVDSGRGVMQVAGRNYDVGPGDAFAFFPRRHYDYHDFPATPWRYTWLIFEGPQVRASLRQVGIGEATPWMRLHPANRIEELLAEIQAVFAHPIVPPSYAIAAGWRLIDVLGAAGAAQGPAASPPPDLAEAARFLIDRHTLEGLSVETLARQLDVSRSALFRHFKAAYGVSPKQHLDALRISRARVLLRQSAAPIKQIAAACGFAGSRHFINAFRQSCGTSPGARRQALTPGHHGE